jgi:glycosyltransferase involved in cell wall biosynthesis
MKRYPGRLGLQQRVLPSYRVPFFDALAAACEGGLSLYAGQARGDESILAGKLRVAEHARARNVHLLGGAFYFCYQPGILNWLANWDPDALILEANPRYLSTPAALRWMQQRGRPVVGWGLGAPPVVGPLAHLRRWGWVGFLNRFDALIAYSQRGAREYAALGFPRERIFVAHNAVAAGPTAKPDDRPRFVDRVTILFVGRLQARKRIDYLLKVCGEMPEPKPRVIIVGDGPERQELERLARKVYPSAEFVGAKNGDELTPFYVSADLFVLPGTGGLAVQQAMAHALPVIVAKGDGTQEDLVRPENGWLIQPETHEALAAALREALADLPRLRRMGAESYRIVAQEINIGKMVEVFGEALKSVGGGVSP